MIKRITEQMQQKFNEHGFSIVINPRRGSIIVGDSKRVVASYELGCAVGNLDIKIHYYSYGDLDKNQVPTLEDYEDLNVLLNALVKSKQSS